MSNSIESSSIEFIAAPQDSRCRYWAKVVRAETSIPMPAAVSGANDVPGAYLRKGDDVEMFVGDFVLVGEANHHVKQRGWSYELKICKVCKDGTVRLCSVDYADAKALLREAGHKDLLRGSGDVAAMIRAIHARRLGIGPRKA